MLQLRSDIAALEAKRNKTMQFNEKVALNLEAQKLKKAATEPKVLNFKIDIYNESY